MDIRQQTFNFLHSFLIVDGNYALRHYENTHI